MPTYRGNRGNLLQHWVLAELIELLHKEVQSPGRLCFFDAHAMSPFAVRATNAGQTGPDFDAVASSLPGQRSMFDRHGPPAKPNPGNMWPSDVDAIGAAVLALGDEETPIVLQLSTYSVNNANGQKDVVSAIEPLLKTAGLELAATVQADRSMMSMVFTRNAPNIDG